VLAPPEVLDYVVVHELCHMRVPDHSTRFWALVERHRPHWRHQRDWLRQHGHELLAFRPPNEVDGLPESRLKLRARGSCENGHPLSFSVLSAPCSSDLRLLWNLPPCREVEFVHPTRPQSGSSTLAVYTLNPKLAAYMPARWTPIPHDVVQAIRASPTGQIPYSEYESSFPG